MLQFRARIGGVGGRADDKPLLGQIAPQKRAQSIVIIDDEDMRFEGGR